MEWSQPAQEAPTCASWAAAGSPTAGPALSKRRPSAKSRKSRKTFSFLVSSAGNRSSPSHRQRFLGSNDTCLLWTHAREFFDQPESRPLQQGPKLADVFDAIHIQQAVNQFRRCRGAEYRHHQAAGFRNNLVPGHRILRSSARILHTLGEMSPIG